METKPTNLTDATRNYYVFQCTTIHPNQRPKGEKITEGCGLFCIKSSKHKLRYINSKGKEEILQGCCTNHPENESGKHKPRLNEEYLKVEKVSSLEVAKMFIHRLNNPNEKPQGLTLPSIETPAPIGGYFIDEPEPFWDDDELRHSRLI